MKTLDEALDCLAFEYNEAERFNIQKKMVEITSHYNNILGPTIQELAHNKKCLAMMDEIIHMVLEREEEPLTTFKLLTWISLSQGFTLAYEMFNTLTDEKMEKEFS